ncbi:hypothetical protein ACLOJK_036203 [Asimina triloba]
MSEENDSEPLDSGSPPEDHALYGDEDGDSHYMQGMHLPGHIDGESGDPPGFRYSNGVTGVGESGGEERAINGENVAVPNFAGALKTQDMNQLMLSFQGEVYVFHSVTPEKVQAVLLLLGGREVPFPGADPPDNKAVGFPQRSNLPQRLASLIRFREKRKERNFGKKIRYTVRKEVALSTGHITESWQELKLSTGWSGCRRRVAATYKPATLQQRETGEVRYGDYNATKLERNSSCCNSERGKNENRSWKKKEKKKQQQLPQQGDRRKERTLTAHSISVRRGVVVGTEEGELGDKSEDRSQRLDLGPSGSGRRHRGGRVVIGSRRGGRVVTGGMREEASGIWIPNNDFKLERSDCGLDGSGGFYLSDRTGYHPTRKGTGSRSDRPVQSSSDNTGRFSKKDVYSLKEREEKNLWKELEKKTRSTAERGKYRKSCPTMALAKYMLADTVDLLNASWSYAFLSSLAFHIS